MPARVLHRTLYVVEPGLAPAKRCERLQVKNDDTLVLELPIIHVDQVMCFGQHPISAPAMQPCLKAGVPIILMRRLGRYVGRLQGRRDPTLALQAAQFQCWGDDRFALPLAQTLIQSKLDNQALVLARYVRHRPDTVDLQADIQGCATMRTGPDLRP